jgi:hypothetical protein
MVTATAWLTLLERRCVTLSIDPAGRLATDAPRGAITDEIAYAIRTHRDLIFAAVMGRRTGHALGPCTKCGEESMVNINRTTWPCCRMTPGCQGRHRPGHTSTEKEGDNR